MNWLNIKQLVVSCFSLRISWSKALNSAGIFFVTLSCFFIPFSTSLLGVTAILACICWILSGAFLQLPLFMRSNISVFLAIFLLLLLTAGLLYTPVPLGEAVLYLKKYRELLIFAVVVSLFHKKESAADRAQKSFIGGCCILLASSYLMYFSLLPAQKFGFSLVHHITHSFFMAILAFWCIHHCFESRKYIYYWLTLLLLTTVNLFFIAPGRTGMLIYIILVPLAIFQRLPLKRSLPIALLISGLITLTYATSHNFSTRVSEAVQEMENYHSTSSRTSLGMRFDWWHNSVDLIIEKPIFGYGTGSFQAAQSDLIKKQKSQTQPSDNPHNEYFLIGVQTGLVGMAAFIALLVSQFFYSFKLRPPQRYLLQGVVISMASGCLMNSFLFDSHQGHFYAVLTALFIASVINK